MSWWCVAWSEEVKDKPVAVRVGEEELVLFRDASAAVKVCEDRCAHRRVPLSLGWVTDKGTIQCGYHGWAYDGGSGQCVEIPNFRPGEPISQRVKVRVFPIAETQGAIFVRLDSTAAEDVPAVPDVSAFGVGQTVTDSIELSTPHADWIEALIADPFSALGLAFKVAGERTQSDSGNGSMVARLPVSAVDTAAPLTAQLEVWAQTGFSQLLVRDTAGATRLNVMIASLPLDSVRTLVRWKLCDARGQGVVSGLLRRLLSFGESGIRVQEGMSRKAGAQSDPAAAIWRNLPLNSQSSAAQARTVEER